MWRNSLQSTLTKLQTLTTKKQLEQTQALTIKTGLFNNPFILSKLLSLFSLSPFGCLNHAQSIFHHSQTDNPFHYNIIIRAYSKSIFPINALCIYKHMVNKDIKCDNFTYTSVIKACSAALRAMEGDRSCGYFVIYMGRDTHCRVFKSGFGYDCFIQNLLICLYKERGEVKMARQLFDEMSVKSVYSWNVMISAYDSVNDFELANLMFESMPVRNVVSWNTLLARYVRLGDTVAAKRVFKDMSEKDAVSWNTMIAGCIQAKEYRSALRVCDEMQCNGVEPTEVTVISVLGACAESGELEFGKRIHESLRKKRWRIEGYLGNALVDMYAKCGQLSSAREVFDELKMKHVTCWNAMIVGLAVHGYSDDALRLFSEMELRVNEVRANRVTFIGVLTACSHKGLVNEGRRFFSRMINEYKIIPDMKHYGCMVDLLSRWGLLDEAYEMIKSAQLEAKSELWRTLLGACRIHSKTDLAEVSFQRLSESGPLRDGDYILLSNIYAETERWHDVEWVRDAMIESSVPKKLGSSNIQMKL